MRLETVEDFEKVAQALKNPKSKPCHYQVRDFGYCRKCHAVTEFDGSFSLEGTYVTCLRCKRNFTWPQLVPGCEPAEMYVVTDEGENSMPKSAQDEIRRLNSREAQLGFFLELLEKENIFIFGLNQKEIVNLKNPLH